MTQHLLVAADRYDLTRLRAICESRLCDMVDVETRRRRRSARRAEPRARAETSLPRVRRAAPGGGDADGRVQAHGAVVPGWRASSFGRWRCTRRSNSRLPRRGGERAPRARRRRGRRVRRTAVAHPGCGGGRNGWRGTREGRARVCSRRLGTAAHHGDPVGLAGSGCRRSLKPRKPPRRLPGRRDRQWRARGTSSMTRPWMSWTRTMRSSPSPRVPEPGREGARDCAAGWIHRGGQARAQATRTTT